MIVRSDADVPVHFVHMIMCSDTDVPVHFLQKNSFKLFSWLYLQFSAADVPVHFIFHRRNLATS